MAGDLLDAPPGLSPRHLSRKLTKSIHSKAVSDLWRRRAELSDTIRHQWLRNLPGDSPVQPESYHGHGEWLHCLSGKWETALLDPVFRLGLSQRLGFPAPGTGQQCGRTPPGSKQCQHILDCYGRQAACCTKGLHTRRHDRVRDLITKLARQAGLTATMHWASHAHPRSATRGWAACPGQRASHPQGWRSHHRTAGFRALAGCKDTHSQPCMTLP